MGQDTASVNTPPKHFVSAATIVNVKKSICNTLFLAKPIGGKITTSPENLEVGFFPIEQALEMVTLANSRQRIEYCLDDNLQPFYVGF